jgi:NAD(P)-dependent dehydrogenase (short-subunit alcohol dehydrogenase family)
MLLEGKTAVIYGGGGSIGGACARAFAREGASVFLSGRTQEKLDAVADEIRSQGGTASTAIVDALDESAVERHAGEVVAETGSLDVSMNVITHPYTHGTPLVELAVEDYMAPIEVAGRTTFITSKVAGRRMIEQGSGAILFFGGPGDRSGPERDYLLGATQAAFDLIESLRRRLSVELGPHGVRVVTLESGGVPDTLPDMEGGQEIVELIEGQTLLGRAATLEDVGNTAAFAASDQARSMTAATINVSSGALID